MVPAGSESFQAVTDFLRLSPEGVRLLEREIQHGR